MPSARGTLPWQPLSQDLTLVAPPVAAAADLVATAQVAPIDAGLADTADFCAAYDVAPRASANCIVVCARRGDSTAYAAVLVRATDRADINKTVRKHLGARKISFAAYDETAALTGMESGGITPVGLPGDWPVLVDTAVAQEPLLVIGGGVRSSKVLVSGAQLAGLPTAEVLALTIS